MSSKAFHPRVVKSQDCKEKGLLNVHNNLDNMILATININKTLNDSNMYKVINDYINIHVDKNQQTNMVQYNLYSETTKGK